MWVALLTLPLYTTVYWPGSVMVKRTWPSATSGTMPQAAGSTWALSTGFLRPGISMSMSTVPSKSKYVTGVSLGWVLAFQMCSWFTMMS